jgi:hypothetical protein
MVISFDLLHEKVDKRSEFDVKVFLTSTEVVVYQVCHYVVLTALIEYCDASSQGVQGHSPMTQWGTLWVVLA